MALYIPPQSRKADEKTPLLPHHSHITADPANKTPNQKARIFFIMGALTFTVMLMWMCYTRLGTSMSLVQDEIGMNGGKGLRFRDDGTFQISVLNDLHFGEGLFFFSRHFSLFPPFPLVLAYYPLIPPLFPFSRLHD